MWSVGRLIANTTNKLFKVRLIESLLKILREVVSATRDFATEMDLTRKTNSSDSSNLVTVG